MAMYKLRYGTQAAYDAKKAAGTLVADDLYFTSDTACIYKGDMLLSASVEAVTEFPASGAQGRIYVDTDTLEAKVWNGSAWVTISPAVETTLTEETATGALVTAGAIRTYIENQIGSASVVQDVAYDSAAQKLTITYGDGSPAKEILLKDLVTDVAYDGTTGNFTFTRANGEAVVVNTPVENFLSAASFDADSNELTLTLENGETVTVNLADLVDVYTAADTASVQMTVSGNQFTANVKLSAAEGNALTIEDDGLFISLADYYTKAEVDAAIKVVADKADANAEAIAANTQAIAKNAEDIAKNAEDIAANGEAIAANGEAIAKNAEDIAANAEAITALQEGMADYYTKAEVDELLSWQEI